MQFGWYTSVFNFRPMWIFCKHIKKWIFPKQSAILQIVSRQQNNRFCPKILVVHKLPCFACLKSGYHSYFVVNTCLPSYDRRGQFIVVTEMNILKHKPLYLLVVISLAQTSILRLILNFGWTLAQIRRYCDGTERYSSKNVSFFPRLSLVNK